MVGLGVRPGGSVQRRRATRAVVVAAATVVGAVAWVVAVPGLGVALRVRMAGQPPMAIGLPRVVLTVLAVSLTGWAFLAILERSTPRAGTIWTAVATGALLLFFAAPLTARAAPAATAALVLMHSIVGLTLIAGLRASVEAPPAPAPVQPHQTVAV